MIPPTPDDREAAEVAFIVTYESAPGTPPLDVYKVRAGVDAVLRVLSERGRLRTEDCDWQRRFDAVDRQYRDMIATLERERDEARAKLTRPVDGGTITAEDYWRERARADAALARAERAERELMNVREWARVWSARVDLAEVEAARLRSLLHRARDAWHYEATSGDGIMEEHAALYAEVCSAIALAPAAEAPKKTEGA